MDVKDEFKLKVEEFCLSIKTNDEDHTLCKLEKLETKPNILISLLKYNDDYKLDLKYLDDIKHKNCKEEKASYGLKKEMGNNGYGENDIISDCKGEKIIIDTCESLLPETSRNLFTGSDVTVYNKKVKTTNFNKQKNKTKTNKVSKRKILNENQMFICFHCNHHSESRTNLIEHLKVHSKCLQCAHCNYSTSRRSTLIKHMSTHGFKSKTYKCSCCNKEFAQRKNLICHLGRLNLMVRPLGRLITTNSDNPQPFVCSTCNAHYGSKYSLKLHMLSHTGDLPFKCTYCDFATKRRYILRDHLQKHDRYSLETISKKGLEAARGVNRLKNEISEREKKKIKRPSGFNQIDMKRCKIGLENKYPFKCDTCGYRTSKRSLLMYHIVRVHTKEPIFKCSTCDFSTSNTEFLQQHRRSKVHDIFSCEHCSFTCFRYLLIQRHMKTHF